MKGLYPTIVDTLTEIYNDNWEAYAGRIETLGLVSGTDPEANYVQLPMDSTQWSESFTPEDYRVLVECLFTEVITVSNDISAEPETYHITVNYLGTLQ
jgi:basic membrane protein A